MTHIGRIGIIEEHEDEMENVCICPHCGRETTYGVMFMICGIHGCPNCHEELHETIYHDREKDYDAYARKANNHEYEPYRYEIIKGDPDYEC